MPEFIFPTNKHEPVDQDGSWQGHEDRHPPSVNPGVDFGCAYGSIVAAAKAGTVNTGVAPHCHVSLYINGVNTDFMLHATAAGELEAASRTAPLEEEEMGKFIRLPNGTIGYVGPDGRLTKLNDMDEVRSIEAVGLARFDEIIQLPDTLSWMKLESISARIGHGG